MKDDPIWLHNYYQYWSNDDLTARLQEISRLRCSEREVAQITNELARREAEEA